ncbi:MAG TPA: GAF domain-containing protein [Gaiellaceae bacterium]|nr:GAF domain-containing protein [Gaiellaceae bacterium]
MAQPLPPQGVRPGVDTPPTRRDTYDTAARELFDRTTRLAASLLDVPVALITIVEDDQLHFASCVGPTHPWGATPGIPLSHSACQHAIQSRRPLAIEDARIDPLVKDSPAIGMLGIVAYIGVPLTGSGGHTIGTLCAIDTTPRAWTEEDARVLQDLAATVTAYLGARPAPQLLGSGLNIAAVAQRTGIGADTLRKWERRYGVLRPSRTSGGQRRYDDRDVARVEWLRDRLSEGFRIGEAAALLETDHANAESSTTGLRDAIVAAVAETDTRRLAALVEQSFTLHDVETAIEEIVAPALRLVGDRWRAGAECIAEEHLLSEVVLARLRTLLGDRRPAVRGTAVLACAPGERHELGLLTLAVLLQADGWLTVYLGTDTPLGAAVSTALRTNADLLCLSASDAAARVRLEAELADEQLPEKLVVVTGGAVDSGEPPLRLGAAVAELRGAASTPRG